MLARPAMRPFINPDGSNAAKSWAIGYAKSCSIFGGQKAESCAPTDSFGNSDFGTGMLAMHVIPFRFSGMESLASSPQSLGVGKHRIAFDFTSQVTHRK